MTAGSATSRSAADRYKFEFCTGDEKDILDNQDINTIFIATRHDSHAEYVLKALKSGKHVFVEKPLCLTLDELNQIAALYSSFNLPHSSPPALMVGYNRRFSPMAKHVKQEFGNGQMAMTYRINAGSIPADSWIQDLEIGGGRIIGEACHFIDFLTFINGSLPVAVYATALKSPNNLNDTATISLAYENGSIGTICYYANGDKSLSKERIEIFTSGATAVIDDFKVLSIYSHGKRKDKKLLNQNKGQEEEVSQFIKALLTGAEGPIPFSELYNTSLATFKIIESIRTGQCLLF